MQPQDFDSAGENGVGLDPVKHVEPSIQILADIILVFTEVQVNCMKDDTDGDIPESTENQLGS